MLRPHAEVTEVWPRDGHIDVQGHLLPAPPAGTSTWRLRLVSRERRQPRPFRRRVLDKILSRPVPPRRLAYPASLDGVSFKARVPIADLARTVHSEHWDVYLVGKGEGGRERLRVGGHHDDMPGKKEIITFPEQRVTTGKHEIGVRPYFTDQDNLSIRCTPRRPR